MEVDTIFTELLEKVQLDADNAETWIYIAKEHIKKILLDKNKHIFNDLVFAMTPKNLPHTINGEGSK